MKAAMPPTMPFLVAPVTSMRIVRATLVNAPLNGSPRRLQGSASQRPLSSARTGATLGGRRSDGVEVDGARYRIDCPQAVFHAHNEGLDTAFGLSLENGRITGIYAMRNPHKLARRGGVVALTRT